MASSVFRSENLIYRSAEDSDEAFFLEMGRDEEYHLNATHSIPAPYSTQNAKELLKWFQSSANGICAVICLPPSASPSSTVDNSTEKQTTTPVEEKSQPTPIGFFHLSDSGPRYKHHRNTMLGIGFKRGYTGKGYGTETIEWVADYVFRRLGLHKLRIGAFGYNVRAIALYERLGFVHEGRGREEIWHDGQWWDDVNLGMLKHEWEARTRKKVAD